MSKKTGAGLVAYAEAQLGLPYWMGTFGQTATAALYAYNKARLPQYYTANDFPNQYGKRVHDCVGLIKGYLWSETPTSVPVYQASQDVNAAGLYARCSRRGNLATMPEVPGVCVFMSGLDHVGVYIGAGWVIEARGHAYGVVKTALSSRGWALWGMPDWISYESEGSAASGDTASNEKGVFEEFLRELMASQKNEVLSEIRALLAGEGTEPSDWIVKSGELAEAVSAGITDGTRPKGYATREEVAAMVLRVFKKLMAELHPPDGGAGK